MSIKYSLMELRNPIRPQDPKKVYAKAQVREEIGIQRLAREISYATTLTEGDVYNVIYALLRKTDEHLADGDLVSLGDFGRFQYQISSEGADSKEEFTTGNIKKVKLQFRPGRLWKPSLDRLQFEQVMSVKARMAAKKNG